MFVQQVQHRVDTVLVAVPQAVDSLMVRVMSLPDTLHAVVRQAGGAWYFIATLVLTAALVGVAIWAHVEMRALQRRNTDLQAEHAKLQREFNEMQAQHEVERREAERKRDQEREWAVDARVGAVAYAVGRQVRSWLDEAPDEMKATVEVVDAWVKAVKQLGGQEVGEVAGVTHGMLEVTVDWASRRSGGHFDRAEERMLQLVAAAPEASVPVAKAVRRALVLFFEATGRMNRQAALRAARGQPSACELTAAYHELESCLEQLDAAVQAGRHRD